MDTQQHNDIDEAFDDAADDFNEVTTEPYVLREFVRETKIPVSDLKVSVEDGFYVGEPAIVNYEVTGDTLHKLTAEANQRGEVFKGIRVHPGNLPYNIETITGKEERLSIIVPVDSNGVPEFDAIADKPEVYTSRSLARAALKKAVADARAQGEVVNLGVIGISVRDNGKALITGRTSPWQPDQRFKTISVDVVTTA